MPLLTIAAAAFAVEIPFCFFGIPSGHDLEFHLYSWLEVLSQWKQGIIYPRWAALAHFAYGEPRFVFYPPASWTLGASLSAIFPWTVAASLYIWMVLVAAGAAMFVLARRWLGRRDATFAAVLYAINPYHLVIVYWRSAFAELLASCLVPLLLLCVLKATDEGRRAIVPLALVLAAAWLTNAPAAVMIHYSLALLLVFFAWRRRSARLLYVGAAAVGLGALLSAFYLLPAIYEQRWINIAEAVSAGSRPIDNFLFVHTADVDHDNFNHIVSWVAAFEMVMVLAAAGGARSWRKTNRELWYALLGWAGACSLLMFPVSALLWKVMPKMQFMQFPWRWLLCVSMISSVLVALGLRRWWLRGAVCAISMLVIVMAWHRIQPPWWDHTGDLREMQDNMEDRVGYEGTDEYTPLGADPEAIDKNSHNVTVAGPARATIRASRWDAQSKTFTAQTSAPDQLALRLFRYPAWLAEVNDRVVETVSTETGQMLIPVQAGMNRVQINFVRTWDRAAGGWISLLTAMSMVLWSLARRRVSRSQTSDLGPQPPRSEVCFMRRILIATSNPGKLRDFAGAAAPHGIEIDSIPNLASLPPVVEDGLTFEENARKKAEEYSRYAGGEIVLADDSGLEVDALNGAPGVHSARYAADQPHLANENADDESNNARLLRELRKVLAGKRTGRFVCVLAAARDGQTLATFRGTAEGVILDSPRGKNGFGYDPLFYFPQIKKTFAELSAEEKARFSHRGAAFRQFLEWCDRVP